MPKHFCTLGRLGEARDGPHTVPLNQNISVYQAVVYNDIIATFLCGLHSFSSIPYMIIEIFCYFKDTVPHSLCLPEGCFSSSFSFCPNSWNPPLYWEILWPVSHPLPAPLSVWVLSSPAPDDMTGSLGCKYNSPQSGRYKKKGSGTGSYSRCSFNHHDKGYNSVQHATVSAASVWDMHLLFAVIQWYQLDLERKADKIRQPEHTNLFSRCLSFVMGLPYTITTSMNDWHG